MPHPLRPWTELPVEEVAAAIGGTCSAPSERRTFGPPTTDSRALSAGAWFVALRGEKFDGHAFCAAAATAGAAGCIVEADWAPPADFPAATALIRVPDTLRAWGELAGWRRREWGGPVLGVSGSAGKTTTRRLVSSALQAGGLAALEPLRNFNNLIGLPHTLLRLDGHAVAVAELGMNVPGELTRLTEIASPDVAVITQIGMAHAGMFSSMQALVEAELEVFAALPAGATLVANAGCPNTMHNLGRFAAGRRVVSFLGEQEPVAGPGVFATTPAVRVLNVRPLPGGLPAGYRFDLELPGQTLADLELRLFGRHHLENVAAAAALLLAGGYDPALVAQALPGFHTEENRGEIHERDGRYLVLDCYNASPPAMLSSLRSLADFPCPEGPVLRRVLVLADMLELGDHAAMAHELQLPEIRNLAPAAVFGLGPQMQRLAGLLAAEGQTAFGYLEREELRAALSQFVRPGDLVFFKGSHGYRLEQLAAQL